MSSLNSPVTSLPSRSALSELQAAHMKLIHYPAREQIERIRYGGSKDPDIVPHSAIRFINWRLDRIQHDWDILTIMLHDLNTSMLREPVTDLNKELISKAMRDLKSELSNLEREMTIVTKQRTFIREDLQDSEKDFKEAYIEIIFRLWRHASVEGQQETKSERTERPKFAKDVSDYLDAEMIPGKGGARYRHCAVLGFQVHEVVKCAHIVPFSFASLELSYMFGAEDATLRSVRNGLFLNRTIEKGYDNGWVAIVPHGSLDVMPIEWKIVLLNEELRNQTLYTHKGGKKETKWGDIDGKKLQFRNEHRPARRYLYFRYVMAVLNAMKQENSQVREKLPKGRIWASPSRKDGYLRRSVLQDLAVKIGDTPLPMDLVRAGTFPDTDPESGRPLDDTKASVELYHRITAKGEGKLKDDDETEEEGEEE